MGGPIPKAKSEAVGVKRRHGGAGAGGQNDFADPLDNLNYAADKFNQQPKQPQGPPGFERFGGLKPFEHHHVPEEIKDHFQYAGHAQDRSDR